MDDILNAIVDLSRRFSTLEQKLTVSTDAITTLCEQMRGVEIQVHQNEQKIKETAERVASLDTEETERYTWGWNLRLYGFNETPNESIRSDIMQLFAALSPEDKEKIGFRVTMQVDPSSSNSQ